MRRRWLTALFALFIAGAAAPAQETHPDGVARRGDRVMGFSHDKTTHHFRLFSGGGAIEVTANDPKDTASRDQILGRASFEIRDDTGLYRIETTGLEYRLWSLDRFSIDAADPLGACGEITFHMQQGRGDWQVRATSRTVLSATRTEFRVHATLDAWEGDERVVARSWSVGVPRNLV